MKNRFVDTNIFIHGLLNLNKELTEDEIQIKENAARIIERIYNGERVGISMAQVSEIANIMESYAHEHALINRRFSDKHAHHNSLQCDPRNSPKSL